MTRLPHTPQPISVMVSAQKRPQRLRWGQHHFVIDQIFDEWQVDTEWWLATGAQRRHYFAVTTAAGALFIIYRDLLTDQWFLEQIYD